MAELLLGGLVDAATHQRGGHDVKLDSADLTTHGVIVGMTGSGKTGLGVVLIEEVLRAGLPALLIDPKGDLTNLCLTFPNLAPADFRPWIDAAQAKAAGVTPDDFAAQQAVTWRDGLAGWGYGPEQIGALRATTDFTIYTPGSLSGIPVNIVGSLQVPATTDPEVVGDEIDGFVTGVLALVGIESDPLSSREHILLANLIQASWSRGIALDLPALVGQIQQPPIRKLGVFELEQFYPSAERTKLAIKLNGLLASPSFAAWAMGEPLDVQSMLYTTDGKGRCAIVTTAHLADEERLFVTSLVLSKLVTWMRRQSGTTDLRALLYLDEVAGYLPPTANPPTKQPIMLLMKQARAFGVGVVLATQNPVDVDYKAISNAGTWMVGRLQTERDKQRLLDGMTAAAGTVDVGAVGDTISALAKREFVLRRAGKDEPEVLTTRWAMSYLRGPMTRDQVALVTRGTTTSATPTAPVTVAAPPATTMAPPSGAPLPAPAPAPPAAGTDPDVTPVMPEVGGGVAVRWVDPAAPWLGDVGGTPTSSTYAAAVIARVTLRYDDTRADLVHDEEYEAVLHPLTRRPDVTTAKPVDYDDRDLRDAAPTPIGYRLTDGPIGERSFWSELPRELVDHLTRSRSLEIPSNTALKLFGRPGESADDFAARCRRAAADQADQATAALRTKYEAKVSKLQAQIAAAESAADVATQQQSARQRDDLLSSAGSILGGLLGGRRSTGGLLGQLGRAAGRTGKTSAAGARVDAAQGKVQRLEADLEGVEDELAQELTAIGATWDKAAAAVTTASIPLEKSDVKVTQLVLAWIPVP
jgi:Helicase HerA, central domain/Helicase HerA-like C-terminal